MEGFFSNASGNTTEIPEYETPWTPSPWIIAMSTLYSIMLTITIVSCLVLTYITYRYGFGSKLNNFLVANWLLFTSVYIVTGSILHFFYQIILLRHWYLGLPGCMVTQFLENICILPLKTIPVILCYNFYRQVLGEKDSGFLSRVSTTIWATAGVWIVIFDCLLGSIYRGRVIDVWYQKRCIHDHAVDDPAQISSMFYVELSYEMLWGNILPLVVMIVIGVLTARRTRGGLPLPKSSLTEKVKVRELILAVMGLTIICRITSFLELGVHGNNLMLHWLLSATLALVCCQREFWTWVFGKFRHGEDTHIMLP